jgi:hypothetical protein
MRDRAFRRHQKKKLLDKWTRIGERWGIHNDGIPFSHDEGFHGWLVRTAENMPICSKPFCCGNPRHLGHETWQEKRARADEQEQTRGYEEEKNDPFLRDMIELGWL